MDNRALFNYLCRLRVRNEAALTRLIQPDFYFPIMQLIYTVNLFVDMGLSVQAAIYVI